MFKVGKSVIYPAYGVTVVKRIETKEVGGKKKNFAVLQAISNHMTLMVPVDGADSLGVRPLVDKAKAKEVLAYVMDSETKLQIDQTTWNRRYREYMEKIKTGNIDEIAFVYKSLIQLRETKDLSFGERKMIDQARELLTQEIATSLEVNADSLWST